MVKKKNVKASFTVEAALICPFLCLVLCGMLQFTLQLYQKVELYAETLVQKQQREISSSHLIRLEAIMEDIF